MKITSLKLCKEKVMQALLKVFILNCLFSSYILWDFGHSYKTASEVPESPASLKP